MAVPAAWLDMPPCQLKVGEGVIKVHFTPAFRIVTTFTVLFRIKPGLNKTLMDVFMAIRTADPDVFEIPTLFFLMAGKTGGGQVGSCQLKTALVVPLDAIGKHRESPGVMAG